LAIPTWSAGQVLTASDVNNWLVPDFAYKTAKTDRTSTTSMTDDPDLILAVGASSVYQFTAVIIYEGGAGGSAGHLKHTMAGPSGAVLNYSDSRIDSSSSPQFTGHPGAGTDTGLTDGLGTYHAVLLGGVAVISTTAGNLSFQWAQGTSSVTRVSVREGSYLMMQRVG
jgi:hypothetical protein